MGFSKSILLTQLSLLAQDTGNPNVAWSLYKEAVEIEPSELRPEAIALDVIRVVPLAAQFGTPEETILIGVQCTALIAQQKKFSYRETELNFVYTIFCPVFTKIMSDWEKPQDRLSALNVWRDTINASSNKLGRS